MIAHPKSFEIARKAAKANNIPLSNVFTIDDSLEDHSGVNDIIKEGRNLPPIERFVFKKGESRRRLAFLSFSSGTSGLPKGVMISHGNIIANLCQSYEFDKGNLQDGTKRVACGVLPFYHSKVSYLRLTDLVYGLHTLLHQTVLFGIGVVIMQSFDPVNFLNWVGRYIHP